MKVKTLQKILVSLVLSAQGLALANEENPLAKLVSYLKREPEKGLQKLIEDSQFANRDEFEIYLAELGFSIDSTSDIVDAIEAVASTEQSADEEYQDFINFLRERTEVIEGEISDSYSNQRVEEKDTEK